MVEIQAKGEFDEFLDLATGGSMLKEERVFNVEEHDAPGDTDHLKSFEKDWNDRWKL